MFYAIILLSSDIQKISSSLYELRYEYFGIIFLLLISRLGVGAIRFHILLNKIGIKINWKDSFQIHLAGLSMIVTPGGMGAIIKSYILKKKLGSSYSNTTPIIIYEKWLDLTSIIIVISILLIWANFIESIIALIIGAIFSSIIFVIMRQSKGINFVNKVLKKIPFLKKKTLIIEEYKDAMQKISGIRTNIALLAFSLIPKIITAVMVFLIFKSFGIDFDIFTSSQIFFTSQLIGFISFIPAGLVATESSLLGLLMLKGLDFSESSILVIVIRFWSVWILTIIGAIFLRLILRKNFENSTLD